MDVTFEQVREKFSYDGKNLRWRMRRPNVNKGDVAGNIRVDGYRGIGINHKIYLAHRLIWLYHFGYFPENGIDHINRKPWDNRLENLREVSQSCNIRNSKRNNNNTSGVQGVHFYKPTKTWTAIIGVAGKSCNLGYSKDFDEAVLLRLAAEQCLGWESCDKMSPAYRYAIKYKLVIVKETYAD